MSKIGRKPIDIGDVQVEIKGQEIQYKGKKASGVHTLPNELTAHLEGKKLTLAIKGTASRVIRESKKFWGLHRALLANELRGASVGFEKQVQINGLGFKAAVSGSKLEFTLGYSHKIPFVLPKEVTVDIDKTGQMLTFKSADREILGLVCSKVREFRKPEPYKGTGIKLVTEVIKRKAGKTKAAAA